MRELRLIENELQKRGHKGDGNDAMLEDLCDKKSRILFLTRRNDDHSSSRAKRRLHFQGDKGEANAGFEKMPIAGACCNRLWPLRILACGWIHVSRVLPHDGFGNARGS